MALKKKREEDQALKKREETAALKKREEDQALKKREETAAESAAIKKEGSAVEGPVVVADAADAARQQVAAQVMTEPLS